MAKSDIHLRGDEIVMVGNSLGLGTSADRATITADLTQGNLSLGGAGADGDLVLRDERSAARIHLSGGGGPAEAQATVLADGTRGQLTLGGASAAGGLSLRGAAGQLLVRVTTSAEAESEDARLRLDGGYGKMFVGGVGSDGVVHVRDKAGNPRVAIGSLAAQRTDETTVAIDGLLGAVTLGGKAIDGDLYVRNGEERVTVHISGGGGPLTRPKAETPIAIDGHTGQIRCAQLMVTMDGAVVDLVARVKALEAELAALKKGRR